MEKVSVWVSYTTLSSINIVLCARWRNVLLISAFVLVTGLLVMEAWYSIGVTTLLILTPGTASVIAAVTAGRKIGVAPSRLARETIPVLKGEIKENLTPKR